MPRTLACAGSQTLWGFQLYRGGQSRVGLAAGVGRDMPSAHREWLQAAGVDTGGLLEIAGGQTPRAWQILEDDGRRTQVMTCSVRTSESLTIGMGSESLNPEP